MIERSAALLAACALLACAAAMAQPAHSPPPQGYVDVHVHPIPGRDGVSSLEEPLAVMAQAHIRKMVLLPPPQAPGMPRNWDYEAFLGEARRYPDRFAFLGGGGSLNVMIQEAAAADRVGPELRARFEQRARRILADGAAGFGEMSPHHLSHMPGHPYESVPADHPLFLLLADIAAEHGAVVDLHLDVVPHRMPRPARFSAPNPETLPENLAGFERLLAHNRGALIVWAHAGSDPLGNFTARLARELLARHPNLHLSIRAGAAQAGALNAIFSPGDRVDPEWLALFSAFPDRFVLGGDQFFASAAIGRGGPGVEFSRRAPLQRQAQARLLAQLPPELARRIGYENATRLYRLKE